MARKFKSSRKYNYNPDARAKKIVLIVLAAILALTAAILLIITLLPGKTTTQTTGAHVDMMSPPEKTTYYVGEDPSWLGLQIRYFVSVDEVYYFGPEVCTITGFDSSAPVEKQAITVSYNGLTTTFHVTILDPDNPNTPSIPDDTGDTTVVTEPKPDSLFVGMSFKTLPRTEYKVGQFLSIKGGVLLLEYENGQTREIPLNYDMVHGFKSSAPGTYTLTVMYMEDGYRTTLTYDITVTE